MDKISWQDAMREAREQYGQEDSDAWYLLEYASGLTRAEYQLHRDEQMPAEVLDVYRSLLCQRLQHVPVQYLTGRQDFMGLEFHVTRDVLIPRPETELMAERVIKQCEGKRVLDVCTGSGCIAISVSALGNPREVVALDISDKCLQVARENCIRHRQNVQWICSDMFTKVDGIFDIIVSNPPYIPSGELSWLMPEVVNYEPLGALDGAEDGLHFYRILAREGREHLSTGGLLIVEIGCEQGACVRQIFEENGYKKILIHKDYSGHDRMVEGLRENNV